MTRHDRESSASSPFTCLPWPLVNATSVSVPSRTVTATSSRGFTSAVPSPGWSETFAGGAGSGVGCGSCPASPVHAVRASSIAMSSATGRLRESVLFPDT